MLAYLLSTLSGDIEVEVSPDYFLFRRKGLEIGFRTIIYISAEEKPRILGVGDEFAATEPNIRIDLFKSEYSNPSSSDKSDCLDAFFRYCIRRIASRTAIVRPRIVFTHSASLQGILCGYQRLILRHIGMDAGARECLFLE